MTTLVRFKQINLSEGEINVTQIGILVWRDTIYAGMARRNTALKHYHNYNDKKKASIANELRITWCANEVFIM